MPKVYIYVVDRDFGFAPNPFHGYCTLATCKPLIRRHAEVDDWVIGMGGARLQAAGRCIFAMAITEKITFDEYWSTPAYLAKRPVRNGSSKMMVGDNIYHRDPSTHKWCQADSHHSNPDGSPNSYNLKRDTGTDQVLLARHFFYFGSAAPVVPRRIIDAIGFKNGIGYRVFDANTCRHLINWLETTHRQSLNLFVAPPFDFAHSDRRYSGRGSKIA
jgi:hypothetical protein